jgi:hypothetical protein
MDAFASTNGGNFASTNGGNFASAPEPRHLWYLHPGFFLKRIFLGDFV